MTLATRAGIIRSEEETENLFSSIDKASTKARRKLRKLKEKSQHLPHAQKRIRASDIVTVGFLKDYLQSSFLLLLVLVLVLMLMLHVRVHRKELKRRLETGPIRTMC